MRWIYIFKTLFIVGPSLVVNLLVLRLNLNRINGHSVNQLLSICCTVLREIHVNKAGESVSIASYPHIAVLVNRPIYNLFLKSALLISFAFIP